MPEISIQTLSGEVIDQIAAGEVVERPSHLVKELVENSLDAGATRVSVEFSDGGRFVKVTDNGAGIPAAQLEKALDRHATSKIRVSDDLWKLKSFGFRGEALASIAAVSHLTLISRTESQETASRLISQFGNRGTLENIGGSLGTTVIVEKLFENVPARLKFMKSAAAESSRIRMALKALALSHPSLEMKITQDGQLVSFWSACSNRQERVEQILELKSLYSGSAIRGGVKAFSVFADPKTVQKTAKDLWFFAQNRWIQDRSLQAAVMEAYRHLLMHGEYPMAVVWVEAEPSDIDVNIHPTKSQVKFADSSLAFRAVQASIRDVLEKAPWLPAQTVMASPGVEQAVVQYAMDDLGGTQFPQKTWVLGSGRSSSHGTSSEKLDQRLNQQQGHQLRSQVLNQKQDQDQSQFQSAVQDQGLNPIQTQNQNENKNETFSSPLKYWSSLQVLAQSNQTYILTQGREGLVIVDQHAAHERVLFEKLMSAWKGGHLDIQEFLFPLAVDLSAERAEALMKEKETFAKLGIQLELLGPECVGIRSAPALLKETALHQVLEKMSQELTEQGGSHFLERKIGDMLATMACHSAIRAGQALSLEEMRALLVQMDEFPLSSFCPHGRPVSVDYPFYRLEKDFGRIV